MFTPILAEFYKQNKDAKNFEIIFASSDSSKEEFDEYYGGMPWLALPFGSEYKEKLSNKYKVQGIPTLVLLNDKAEKITDKARSFVSTDPQAKEFPWSAKPLPELLKGPVLLSDASPENTIEFSSLKAKTIGLYFSAHWCPPCRKFTPELVEFYKKYKEEKEFEIIFLSCDKDHDSFLEYFKEMPWLALPFDDPRKALIISQYDFDGSIPTLLLLTPEGALISRDARSGLSDDPEGKSFPWVPKPVVRLRRSVGRVLNETAVLIVDYPSVEELEEALPKVEEMVRQLPKEDDDEDELVVVLTSKKDTAHHSGLRETIYEFTKEVNEPKLLLISIPTQKKHVSSREVSLEAIRDVVVDFRKKKLACIGIEETSQ